MKRIVLTLFMVFVYIGAVKANDYHVMTMVNDASTNQITVIYHIPVIDENNTAGYSLRSAVSEEFGTQSASVIPWDIGSETASLQVGTLFEHIEIVQVEDSLTLGQKRTILDERFTELNLGGGLNKLYRNRLDFWHLERDVP